ncbi:MAG TPA: Xaa-Pro peptidase family protein [Pirellulales bacterium]|jgi:Xaa-Pro aminopeptidase|nr:Xaa-Pro peptidase family protein [Pirellulales bacterium]
MLLREKADQAQALLQETKLDCWLIFARETDIHPDPGVELVVGAAVVRNSAFLFGAGGERIAIVARFDVANVRATGVFGEVIGYDEDIQGPLLAALRRIDPRQVGLNYSTDDVTADGLTHGHWLLLNDLLRDTPYVTRLTSAAGLLSRLRGRKSPGEIDRIRRAVAVTEEILDLVAGQCRPGASERQLANFVHQEFRRRSVVPAWPCDSCPVVNVGPASEPGHASPRDDLRIEPGHLVHIDMGVRHDGYCSDLQRTWYVVPPGATTPPEDVERAFRTVVRAIEAGAAVLRPGVRGYEVDAAARRVVVEAGYPEYKHGTGHSLGRAVHDGGTGLGPRWPCYGRTTEGIVEANNVYTLELGVTTAAGFVGIEEDVMVTADGCEFLSTFQRELILV